ncbi:MAG: TRAP transporter small permease [Desulfocapsaceae bacterium]
MLIKLLDKVCQLCAVIAALLLLFVTFSITYSIITRQMGLGSPIWVFQFNEYSLLWITFLGTAWLLAENKHVQISLLTTVLGDKVNKGLDVIHNIVGSVLCGVLAWYGFFSTKDHLVRNVIDTQAVDVPKWIILVVIPFGFTLLSLQFLRKLYVSVSGPPSVVGPDIEYE